MPAAAIIADRTQRPHHARRWRFALAALALTGVALVATAGTASAVDPPQCPAPAGAARVARLVYVEAAFRCPDAGGLAYWTKALSTGTAPSAMGKALLRSEAAPIAVHDQFALVLGRAPDAGGLAFWTKYLDQTGSVDGIRTKLLASAEFGQRFPKPADQVNFAYLVFVHTSPDAGGAAYWTQYLATGGNRSVLAHALAASDVHLTQEVTGAYGDILDRAPDAGGLAHWKQVFSQDHDWIKLEASLMNGPEFAARAQTQPPLPV